MNSIYQIVIRASIWLNQPRMLFWLAIFSMRKRKNCSRQNKYLGFLSEAFFEEDVHALSVSKHFNFLKLDKLFLTEILRHFSSDAHVSHKNFHEIMAKAPRESLPLPNLCRKFFITFILSFQYQVHLDSKF